MAQLLVRKLEESVVKKLRLRAARAGVSVEEEHRRILKGALKLPYSEGKKKKSNFKEWLVSNPSPFTDEELHRPKEKPRRLEF